MQPCASSSSSSKQSSTAQTTSSTQTSSTQPAERSRSPIAQAMEKAKAKLSRRPSGSEALPNDEKDFEKQEARAVEKQKRKEEYERLGLAEQTKYGMGGAGGWKAM
ncbi:hypothetical protein B0A50_01895 [Salinomyces thailandicus]|uniref:Uncharacterized protein n=1 Tax=Salinomyces thailandicus TaxID=706561 RepID=A0A4U0UBF5_9PEZI|nr:hypothetical protein B0A50_01895 [Salinomyces thailandica]